MQPWYMICIYMSIWIAANKYVWASLKIVFVLNIFIKQFLCICWLTSYLLFPGKFCDYFFSINFVSIYNIGTYFFREHFIKNNLLNYKLQMKTIIRVTHFFITQFWIKYKNKFLFFTVNELRKLEKTD